MEPQQTASAPNPEPATAPSHGLGPLVGALIVLAVLVLGGVYFLTSREQAPYEEPPVILGDVEKKEQAAPRPSNSDAVDDISADVNAADLDDMEAQMDADLQTIEANL